VDAGREGAPGTEDPASVPSSVLHVVVAPPLPMMGDEEQGIMLGPYYPGSLVLPQARSSLVRIYRVTDWSGVSGDQVRIDVLHTWWPAADIAPTPSLLPLTPEQAYQRGLENLRRFAAREGHTDVPLYFKENGQNLGIWVGNTRRFPLPSDKAAQLASIPGWRWLSSEDLQALRSYADRTGHTDPPVSRDFEAGFLENVVRQVRTQYESGLVNPEEVQRLEEVPHWHW
jgi:hypothetical protein